MYDLINFVQIESTDHLLLPGLLFEPKRKSKKAVILLHGNGSSSVFYSMPEQQQYGSAFTNFGYAYLALNNRGSGLATKLKKAGSKKSVYAGTYYELIKDCVKDIDGAIKYLKKLGYQEIYLLGFSTGANKICVYNYYKPRNPVSAYMLICGGDDTGLFYEELGKKKFELLLKKARREIRKGNGSKRVPGSLLEAPYSYRAIYDTINPDGNYNTFPYNEYFNNLKLSKKKLFREFSSINKPSLVVYGASDEYAYGKVPEIVELLKRKTKDPKKFAFEIITGADHQFTGKQEQFLAIIISWLRKN